MIKGYVPDSERLKNGKIFDQNYFDRLLEEIREIRASERQQYQKVTDLFATAFDYDYDVNSLVAAASSPPYRTSCILRCTATRLRKSS